MTIENLQKGKDTRMVAFVIYAALGLACSVVAAPSEGEADDTTKDRILTGVSRMVAKSLRPLADDAARQACEENFLFVSNLLQKCELNCRFERLDDGTPVMFDSIGGCDGAYGDIPCHLAIDDKYVHGGALFPEANGKNTNIVEFVALANRIVTRGSFEHDPEFGFVMYMLSMPVSDIRSKGKKALGMVYGFPVMEVDLYSEAYKAVLEGKKTPEEAMKIVREKIKGIDENESLDRSRIEKAWYQVRHTTNDTERIEGVAVIRESAEAHDHRAESLLGWCHEKGLGCERNLEKAYDWYLLAAEGGRADAQMKVGYLTETVKNDITNAVIWYRRGAEGGNARAQCNLANCLRLGRGVEKDGAAAIEWYRKSAAQGDEDAQYNLGVCCHNGLFCKKDDEVAVRLFLEAAQRGHEASLEVLERCGVENLSSFTNGQQHAEQDLEGLVYKVRLEGDRDKDAESSGEKAAALSERVRDFLDEYDVEYKYEPLGEIIRCTFGVGGKIGQMNFILQCRETCVACYLVHPVRADASRRDEMAKLLIRLNYDEGEHSYDMDYGDGEIRLKATLKKCDLHYTEDVSNHTLRVTILAEGLFHHVDVKIVVDTHHVRCYHKLPISVVPEFRGEAAKLIAELNGCFSYGAFEMDCRETGRVCFRHMLTFETVKYGGGKRIGELLLGGMMTIKNHEKRLWAVCGGLKSFDDVWEEDWDVGQRDPK